MTDDEIKELEKAVSKAKFTLSQKASDLHDLIEDRLPVDYKQIPIYAEAAFKSCEAWDILNQQLINAKK